MQWCSGAVVQYRSTAVPQGRNVGSSESPSIDAVSDNEFRIRKMPDYWLIVTYPGVFLKKESFLGRIDSIIICNPATLRPCGPLLLCRSVPTMEYFRVSFVEALQPYSQAS